MLKNRTGETRRAKNGMMMTIVDYRRSTDIDVQFEDGTICKNIAIKHFYEGNVRHPLYNTTQLKNTVQKIGESSVAANGMKITIIAYRNCHDFDLQFEDGTILKHYASQKLFKQKKVGYPKNRIGQTIKATNGQTMTIIAYRDSTHIDVQFEDGTIITDKTYDCFKEGTIRNPNKPAEYKPNFNDRTGETRLTKQGVKQTIKHYKRYEEVVVLLEGGVEVKTSYHRFKNGEIKYPLPHTINNIVVTKFAFTYNRIGNFYCHCNKCGLVDIMSVNEMKNHICQNKLIGSVKQSEPIMV